MALGFGWELPPGPSGGKTIVEARGARPAQAPGHVGVCGQVALRNHNPSTHFPAGVVSHAGSLNSGHYVAYSRDLPDPASSEKPGWHYFSDTTVQGKLTYMNEHPSLGPP